MLPEHEEVTILHWFQEMVHLLGKEKKPTSTLMMETAGSLDMPVHMYQIAWHHIPEGGYFQNKKQHKQEK